MAERNVLADGLKRCNRGAVRLFRNSVGVGYVCRGKPVRLKDGRLLLKGASAVRFGLAVGSGDTIGFRQVTITTEMVGRTVAVFLSAEAKSDTGRGRVGDDQARWRDFINRMGGIALVFESAEELERALAEQFDGVLTSATDSDHD